MADACEVGDPQAKTTTELKADAAKVDAKVE